MKDTDSAVDFDAIVVGAGPNGLASAIKLRNHGCSVLLLEAKAEIGGGIRSAELTLPGFVHDVCSAIHPMVADSPFMKSVPLHKHNLEFINPEISCAHPFDDGSSAILGISMEKTIACIGEDRDTYLKLLSPIINDWDKLEEHIYGPLKMPKYPFALASFGLQAMQSSIMLANRFKTKEARGLIAGMSAHAIQPLSNIGTAAIGLVLMAAGHRKGWPFPKGGANNLARALESYYLSIGGKVQKNCHVKDLSKLPSSRVVLLDLTPKQILELAGYEFSKIYSWQLKRYRYGMGVFKMDWALDGPIPFINTMCQKAGVVHLGGTLEEIARSEKLSANGGHPISPFVLLAQQSRFDSERAPDGKHVAWGYCHVPNGSKTDMSSRIENQIERFAPGFRDRIIGKSIMNCENMEEYNSNYVGGDINGGLLDIRQLFTRPALRYSPYRTSKRGLYICSSSTPPGAGVHGMCGYHSADRAIKDFF